MLFRSEKIIRNRDSAGDRSTSVNLLHHVLFSLHATVLLDVVLGVVLDGMARISATAVTANVEVSALVVIGSVTHATLLGNSHGLHHLVGREHVSSVATLSIISAVDNDLRRELLSRPGSLGHETKTVRNGRGSGESPAGSAVLGNVLVLGDGDVGDTVNVTTRELSSSI